MNEKVFFIADPLGKPDTITQDPLSDENGDLPDNIRNRVLLNKWWKPNVGRIVHYATQQLLCDGIEYYPRRHEKENRYADLFIEAISQESSEKTFDNLVYKANYAAAAISQTLDARLSASSNQVATTLAEVYAGPSLEQIQYVRDIVELKKQSGLRNRKIVKAMARRTTNSHLHEYAELREKFEEEGKDIHDDPTLFGRHILAKISGYNVTIPLQTSPETTGKKTVLARRIYSNRARADLWRLKYDRFDTEVEDFVKQAGEFIKGKFFGRRELLDLERYTSAELRFTDSFFQLLASGRVQAELIEIKTDNEVPIESMVSVTESLFDTNQLKDEHHLNDISRTILAFWQLTKKLVNDPDQRRNIMAHIDVLGIQVHLGKGQSLKEIMATPAVGVEIKTPINTDLRRFIMKNQHDAIRQTEQDFSTFKKNPKTAIATPKAA